MPKAKKAAKPAKAAPKAPAVAMPQAMSDIKIKPLSTAVLDALNAYLKKSGLEEIEITQGDAAVRLKRPGAYSPALAAPVATTPATEAAPSAKLINTFNAPMIGTFYRAASPEAAPFTKVGDHIKQGQVLCIIEAMKTMNQIESDRAGKVVKILIENATPVEFGQPLFVIE